MRKFCIILFIVFSICLPSIAKKEIPNGEKTIEYLNIKWWDNYKDEYLKDWEFIDAIYHIINDGAFFYKFKSFEKNSEKALFYIIPKALRIKGC